MGLLVIEAAEKSGTLITARLANELGRLVFALPGSPLDPRATGTNNLIKAGAIMVMKPQDILDNLLPLYNKPNISITKTLTQKKQASFNFMNNDSTIEVNNNSKNIFLHKKKDLKQKVLELLSVTPVSIDFLSYATNSEISELSIVLTELEITGQLQRLSGSMVSIKK